MRKNITRILAVLVTIIVAVCIIVPIFADDFSGTVWQNNGEDFTCETEVSYRQYSSFYVTIPTAVAVDEYGEITVDVSSVEQGNHVSVYATNLDENGKVNVKSQYGDDGKLSVYVQGQVVNSDGLIASFYPANWTDGIASTSFNVMNDQGLVQRPGLYTGNICFRVCIEND